jgi:DNA processing protein
MTTIRPTWRIDPTDTAWPAQLNDLGPDAPTQLFCMGTASSLLEDPARLVTVTGSRASTPYGENVAGEIGAHLWRDHSMSVVTGGGYGIDAATTRGSLAVDGSPIAVLASGLDTLYPRGNARLFERVAECGLIVTEHPEGTAPTRANFTRRGLIMAALSGTTHIVEAPLRSGALPVATSAASLGRSVTATPGPVTSACSDGPNHLIANGVARLAASTADIVERPQAYTA